MTMMHATGPQSLFRRYVLAIVIIIALISGSHFASTLTIAQQEGASASINISGRQRMLERFHLFMRHIQRL